MIALKGQLSTLVAGAAVFSLAVPGLAQALPPVPAGGDAYMVNQGGGVFAVTPLGAAEFVNTGINAGTGLPHNGVTLVDVAPNGTLVASDYVYSFPNINGGVSIAFSSDSETSPPGPPPTGIPNVSLTETGGWQDVSGFFGLVPGAFYVESDTCETGKFASVGACSVPEPATWTMILVGFGLAGLAMRRRAREPIATA
ncbi:MAG TPA: PEPxxWA-CTERM sorting domain-containing protein [Caulobacteraceae bacterium]|nr:PEPxxWA-CTERM sorting domain-containing protein [Caulobacteraceae bacterium]